MKKVLVTLLGIVMAVTLSSCKNNPSVDGIAYFESDVISSGFRGIGVEWGTYEDTDKLYDGAWNKIINNVNVLKPSLVRCMTNFDWFVTGFDDKGTTDLNDDTWTYNFKNKYMENALLILDYCESHNVSVAFGVWNVIGDVNEETDIYKMIPNATSDIRWAKMCADLMDFLVNKNGYTCIKWFVNTNEPNYKGLVGSSKNAYNSYDKWETGVKNVRKAFDKIGLKDLDIIGGDCTSFAYDTPTYMEGIAKNLKKTLNNYGVHMYVSNIDIANGNYQTHMKMLYDGIKKIDSGLGKTKDLLIWETGLLDGKNASDCNELIANSSYGLKMANLTIQSILSGVNGLCYWDLDDAMHFMYTSNGTTAKEWGMFSTLASADSRWQELRPWYHSSCILSNALTNGSIIYNATYNKDYKSLRSIASVSSDFKDGSIILINDQAVQVNTKVYLEKEVSNNEEIFVYIYNESNLRLNSDGYVTYNYKINGSINKLTEINVPAGSMVVLTTKEIGK